MKSINKFLVVMLCFVLFTTMAFALSACIEKELKIAKIEVSGPSETAVGEFDYNDYTVKLIFDDGSTKDIKLNKDLLSASDRELLDTPGTHTITVQYNDVTCTFTVTIKGDGESQDKGIKSIAISGPNEIVAGDIDYNDFSLVITYEDDSTTAIELREEFILEEDRAKLNTVGSHSISITYNGTTTTWNITVKENESTGDNIFEGVTFEDATYTYDGREKSIEVKGVPDGATVRYNVSNSYTNAGVYPIEATISKEGYKTLVLTATLTINKATYDMSGVKFVDKTVVYNGETQRIEISGSLPQGVTVSYDNNENINVGTYEVVAKFTGDSNNYETIADMTATLTINKATYDMSSVKFVDKTVVYNGEVQRIEISGSLPQGVTVTYENNDKTDVGTYEVVAKFTGDSNNYETIADMTATLTIIESDFEGVTFEDATCTYDGREKSIEVNGVPNGATVKYNVSNSYTNAGIYPIEATISKEGYKTLVLTATLTINKATYDMSSVEFVDKTVVYNGEVQRIEISGNLPQGVTVSYENNENINVGTYEVVAKFTGDSDNYNVISDKTAQLIINKATYDMSGVEFEGKTVVYNGEVQRIEISGSLPQGVTVTYENNDKTDVGTYEVVAKFTGDSNNYETIADMTANLTINKATYDMSSIEFADKTVIYNGEVQRLAIRGTLPQGVTVSYENNGNINVGTYTVTAKFTGDSKNYKPIADMTATLTIKEAKETEGLMFEKINNDTEYSVVGYEGEDSDIVILSTHEGLPVTTIGYMAFYWCNSLTSITIPDSIMSIGESAFTFCDSLTDVHYTGDIAGWCNIQFDDYISNPMCYADNLYIRGELLEGSLTIPEGVTSIGDYAFYSCNSLISITIPDSVTSIGAMSFANCSNLTSITIPDSVTSIEDSTFYNCYRLTSITIPDSVTSIGNNAFYGCNSLTSITISDRVTSIGENSFSGCSGLTSITIPNSVTSIGEGAFSGCSGLTSITIPDSVTSIGSSTFSNCDSLTSITIPHSVTSIGENSFSGCSGLTSITIPFVGEKADGTGATYLGYIFGASSYTDNSSYVSESLREVIITGGTSIGWSAFEGCSALTSITIPDSVTSIGSSAFYECSGLKEVHIRDIAAWCGIEFVNSYSNPLYYAHNLYINGEFVTELVIPDSVTSIGSYAFYDCTGLTSISIPDSVTSIGDRTFYNCDSLTSITIPDSVTSIGEGAFSGCSGLTSITIPDSVTSIREGVFSGCSGLTSIMIPDSVTSIGNSAFYYCSGLTSITIPDSVTSIGEWAFYYCSGLTSITIPNSVTSIGERAFYDCTGLTSITIPDSVTSIGDRTFYNCDSLTSITIPDSVTSIGENSFSGCSGLTSITIPFVGEKADGTGATYFGYIFGASRYTDNSSYVPKSLREIIITGGTSIGDDAFYCCSGLTSITIPDSVTSIGYYAFRGCSGLTSITIPDSVTSIGDWAFEYCSGLASVTISDSVTSIGERAFYDCTGLTSITIPNSVTSIGNYAFSGCRGLTSITVAEGNSKYHSQNNCIIETASKTLIAGCKTSVIPDDGSVTSIGNYAFYNCSGLTSITIPDSITSIGDSAFYNCDSVTNITIPDGVTSIGNYAFYNCSGLTSITIPDSVSNIGSYAFYGCSGLTSITIPDSVKSIGDGAFLSCTGLVSITIPFIGENADGTGATYFGYIFGASGYYSNSYYVPESLREVIITGGTKIGSYAFYNCSGLTSITIPDSVTSIGEWAFYNCTGLTSITIPDSVTSIGERAFYNCTGLISITIPDSITSIGRYVFSGCTELTSITIPASVTSIGSSAFYGCSGLTSITIPNGVTSIGNDAFYYCIGLTSVTIGNSVTSIGGYAFEGCSGLTSITIPNSVTSIGEGAFSGCSGLTSIRIGNGVTSIGYSAFKDCSGIESITIPFIGENADGTGATHFGYIFGASRNSYNSSYVPRSLREVTITGGTSIGSSAFYECTGLTSITIPNSVTSIGNYAFDGCRGLTSITVAEGNSKYHSQNNCIIETASKTLIAGCKTSIIPDDGSVTSIGDGAFSGCSGLTSITIPDSVTSIGSYAFYYCSGLTSITIPDSVTSIGSHAFEGCSGLTSITIPDSVTSIGDWAFSGCSGLTSITIPDSVTSIGEWAFYGCSNLTNVTFENTQGWWYSSSSSAMSGTSISSSDLADPATAATYLTSTYYNYYWKRS